jgi:hypothetical protein
VEHIACIFRVEEYIKEESSSNYYGLQTVSCFMYSTTLKMKTTNLSEMSVDIQGITQ